MSDGVSVQVALRIRPLVESETSRGCVKCLETTPSEPQVLIRDLAFTYNHVFPPEVSQAEVYETAVKHMVLGLFKGYNVTVLAYGQTGSGKTHSMGTAYSGDPSQDMGVIPRAVCDIFDQIGAMQHQYEFKVQVSFMELYQEQLFDLLSTRTRDQTVVDIREDNKGIIIPGLTELQVTTAQQTIDCLVRGSGLRAVGATAMNQLSSRSHAIFTIYIQQQRIADENSSTTSKFHLVDLAGSERANKTKATGNRFKEGIKINQGLLALGNVISSLGEGSQGFIGYRDSKLTRLLQDSLGGNSLTLMIACVSPADYNLDETISTLRYADRARKIKNKPVVNQDPRAAEINKLKMINEQLRLELLGKGGSLPNSREGDRSDETEQLKQEIKALKEQNHKMSKALDEAVMETANMYEKAILADAAKDRVSQKLAELTELYNQCIEQLTTTYGDRKDVTFTFQSVRDKIAELQYEQKKSSEEILQHDIEKEQFMLRQQSHEDISYEITESEISETDMQAKQASHITQQTKFTNELQQLNKELATKEALCAQVAKNHDNLSSYQENIKENEHRISMLQKEKDELLQQIRNMSSVISTTSSKLAEERRKKVQQLESQISELTRKVTQQAKLIKMKEKDDIRIKQLHGEIITMKANRVKLIRTMRAESEGYRAWKIKNEKELCQLRTKDMKRQNAMVRMESMHNKQQNVLKRKVEEAMAINKRLKDALDKQKNAQTRRANAAGQSKQEQVQSWVAQELDVLLRTVDAERTLEQLMEDRAYLYSQLEQLKSNKNRINLHRQEIDQLTEHIALRTAQISDFQQKILDSDQENKSKSRWETIQSMIDAKIALKYLFEMAAEMRREASCSENKYREMKLAHIDAEEKICLSENRIHDLMIIHKNEMTKMESEHEEKVGVLLRQLRSGGSEGIGDTDMQERILIQEEALERMDDLQNELDMYRQECAKLRDQLQAVSEVASKLPKENTDNLLNVTMPIRKHNIKPTKAYTPMTDWSDNDEIFSDNDDLERDPDYVRTPLYRKVQTARIAQSRMGMAVKRSSDGQTKCACNGTCHNRVCGCKKMDLKCSSSCKCSPGMCINRDDKENVDDNNSEECTADDEDSSVSEKTSGLKRTKSSMEKEMHKKNIKKELFL